MHRRTNGSFLAGAIAWAVLFCGTGVADAQSVAWVSADSFNPNPVAPGSTTTAAVDAAAAGFPDQTDYYYYNNNSGQNWSWSVTGADGAYVEQDDPSVAAGTLWVTISTPGSYTLTLYATVSWTAADGSTQCATQSVDVYLVVVAPYNIQYRFSTDDSWLDVTDYLCVLVNQPVILQITPAPDGDVVWRGTPDGIHSGAIITVTFPYVSADTSDSKTVSAQFGQDGETTISTNVIVYDLVPTMTPADNFDGRDLDYYGVCEIINLSLATTPQGLSRTDTVTGSWINAGSGGALVDNGDGTGTYQCADITDTVTLDLLFTGGPMIGQINQLPPKGVVPPDGHRMDQAPGTGILHFQNFCSLGFKAFQIAICYKNVSFKEIQVREGECLATADGYLMGMNNQAHKATSFKDGKEKWFNVGPLPNNGGYIWIDTNFKNADGGNPVVVDENYTGTHPPPFGVGSFYWPIPMMYRKIGDVGVGNSYGNRPP